MGKARLLLPRTGSAMMLVAVLIAGCGEDEPSTGVDAAGEQTPEGGSGAGAPDSTAAPDKTDDAADADETDDASSDNGNDASSEDGDTDENVETIEITIADGGVSPPFDTYQVALGADVRIEIISDTADELHLHGYDLELAVEPGEAGVMEFTADIEGRFELETHDLGLQLLQLEVG